MKITWFGGTTLRIHIGGQIVVVDADAAPEGIDQYELVGGADRLTALAGDLPHADGTTWKPRPARRLLDEDGTLRNPELWSIGAGTLLVDADGEAPLLVIGGAVPALGRWAQGAVVVVLGETLAERAGRLLDAGGSRLLVLGGSEAELDAALAQISGRLDGTGLMALEPGLALES